MPCVAQRLEMAEHLLGDDRRQAEADLVGQQQPGRPISARASASICCSPPLSVEPSCFSRRASGGNIVSMRS